MVQGMYLELLVDIHIFEKVVVHAENFKHKVDCDDLYFLISECVFLMSPCKTLY
jgi:predicted HAD superfamily hydrolase